jgi:hypothetical protein
MYRRTDIQNGLEDESSCNFDGAKSKSLSDSRGGVRSSEKIVDTDRISILTWILATLTRRGCFAVGKEFQMNVDVFMVQVPESRRMQRVSRPWFSEARFRYWGSVPHGPCSTEEH